MTILLQNQKASDSLISSCCQVAADLLFSCPAKHGLHPLPRLPVQRPPDLSAHLPSGSAGSFTDSSFSSHSCLWEGPEAGLDIPFFPQADDVNPVLMASPVSLSKGNQHPNL